MAAPLLRISVDLASGRHTVACGGCGDDALLEADDHPAARSATMTAFVAAHATCHGGGAGQAPAGV